MEALLMCERSIVARVEVGAAARDSKKFSFVAIEPSILSRDNAVNGRFNTSHGIIANHPFLGSSSSTIKTRGTPVLGIDRGYFIASIVLKITIGANRGTRVATN